MLPIAAEPLIIIPARMAAGRLPGKPLLDIAGTPLILHVWRSAHRARFGRILVATDTPEIIAVIEAAGGNAILTRQEHETGSDRVFEAAVAADPEGRHDIVINLQADMPCIAPDAIGAATLPLTDSAVDIGTLAAPLSDGGADDDPNVVKVIGTPVAANRLRARGFTRAPGSSAEGDVLQHIGVYAFRRSALTRFAALPRSPLEKRERLEQLRALEAGMRIDVTFVQNAPMTVDTPADLARARAYFGAGMSGKRDS